MPNGSRSNEQDYGLRKLSDPLKNNWLKAIRLSGNLIRHVAWITRMAVRHQERHRDRDLGIDVGVVDHAIARWFYP